MRKITGMKRLPTNAATQLAAKAAAAFRYRKACTQQESLVALRDNAL